MPQLAIIADDVTGAADTGAPFAQAGLATYLALTWRDIPPADALILSTESRHLPPGEAQAQVRRAVSLLQPAAWVYKKIDSTLRGQAGPELDALMDELAAARALVAPAFPAQGRTTIGSRQMVNGTVLEQTAFAGEVSSSDLRTVFGQSGRPMRIIGLDLVRRGPQAMTAEMSAPGIYLADAESDSDLQVIAQAAVRCQMRVLCGSAGLAEALIAALPLHPSLPVLSPWRPAGGAILIVAGSRNPRTLTQIQVVKDNGAALIAPDGGFLEDRATFDALVAAVAQALATHRLTVLTSAAMPFSPLGGKAVAYGLAQVVHRLALEKCFGALILTGGDIAAAVYTALESMGIWLCGEVQRGIPWGVLHGGLLPGLPVVSKAGGFGADDVFVRAAVLLEQPLPSTRYWSGNRANSIQPRNGAPLSA